MTTTNKSCENCKYFAQVCLDGTGKCLFMPPTPINIGTGRVDFITPQVHSSFWCGQFTSKKDQNKKVTHII